MFSNLLVILSVGTISSVSLTLLVYSRLLIISHLQILSKPTMSNFTVHANITEIHCVLHQLTLWHLETKEMSNSRITRSVVFHIAVAHSLYLKSHFSFVFVFFWCNFTFLTDFELFMTQRKIFLNKRRHATLGTSSCGSFSF